MAASDRAAKFRAWLGLLGVLLAALIIAGVWRSRRTSVETPVVVEAQPPRKIVGEALKPQPRPSGYVGSEACATCHPAIAESYKGHSMYRSAGATPGTDDVENFAEGTEFKFDDGRIYQVEKRDDGIYHHEVLLDNEGEVLYDQAAKISFFIGSGTRGKSYAINRGGVLFQSPISWYTTDHKWDLSPGYGYRHKRFGRRIPYECVDCHSGRPTHDGDHDDYFPDPVLVEAAIGCERCHGPGREHVELHENAPAETDGLTKADDPIVSPSRLDPDRREAVCYQCHLIGKMRFPRYGRTSDDFRPGDRLDEVWAIMVAGTGVRGDQKTKAVSHVEQMRESKCFKSSEGRFGCTSCHDAHTTPAAGQADAYYRQRCLDCHAEKGCSLSAEKQAAAPANNSCIYCHMPKLAAHDVAHASQTDHRVLRAAPENEPNESGGEGDKLELFDQEHTVMPEWELERVLALSKVRKLQESNYASKSAAEELEQTLLMIADIAQDDARTWAALGNVADLRQDVAGARKYWLRALQLRPNDEIVLDSLVRVCQQQGDYQSALDYADRLIELNPNQARDYFSRALMLAQFGRLPEALADAERAVEIEPLDKKARRWLRDAYRQTGDLSSSRRHEDFLRRISALPQPPG
ncbi:MAG TPA: tetratricopeptide repeat protein [Pirellulales bacterium]|nr:tetratricopeptide repeat protein [Pirellulales bacterium]